MIAHHVIFSMYGFWLPNDPRGSGSRFIGSWELFRYGPATKTTEQRSVAHCSHDVAARLTAKEALKYPPVTLHDRQLEAVGRGFATYVNRSGLVVRACAILPDHVHLVFDDFRLEPKQVVIQLKGDATQRLVEEALHPFGHLRLSNGRPPKCWGRGEWIVYLDTIEDVLRSIEYVEQNPVKEGRPRQTWPFVTPLT